jgi:hypothetical protein
VSKTQGKKIGKNVCSWEGTSTGKEEKKEQEIGKKRGGMGKKSQDKAENAARKGLMEWIEENGWEVLNGNKQGDEEGEWSYVGSRGKTVIDYGIVKEEAWERVE